MKRELILPYKDTVLPDEAMGLKILGFDENCRGYYHGTKPIKFSFAEKIRNKNTVARVKVTNKNGCTVFTCTAPTYSQAFDWFRKEHNLHSFFPILGVNLYSYEIKSINNKEGYCVQNIFDGIVMDKLYPKYEEAELECLRRLIDIINVPKK